MLTTHEQFSALRGHVADGCKVKAPSGRIYTVKNTMKGWVIIGPDGFQCSGNLPSAFDVECFIVNGLQSS